MKKNQSCKGNPKIVFLIRIKLVALLVLNISFLSSIHSVDLWNDATQYAGQQTLGEMYSNVNGTYHHQMSKVVEEFCLKSKVNGNPKESCLLATFEASIFDKSDVRCKKQIISFTCNPFERSSPKVRN